MRHAITTVEDHPGGSTTGVQGEHRLNGHVHRWCVELFEEDLRHLLAIGLGVQRSFGQQNRVLFRCHTQFVVEGVMPDLLHVVPVGDNAVFDGVTNGENTFLC